MLRSMKLKSYLRLDRSMLTRKKDAVFLSVIINIHIYTILIFFKIIVLYEILN